MISHIHPSAKLIEVFSAIQGEGLNVGTRQIFIRLAMCDLRCDFCDSAHTWGVPSTCQIEKTPGGREFESYSNPVSASSLLAWVNHLNLPGVHDSISVTGGEPLLQTPFLKVFLPELQRLTQLPIYLETGGHRPQQLSLILAYLDLVGMDFKLPSVSGEEHWQAHAEFLQLCQEASVPVFVKIIIANKTNPADLRQAAELVAAVNPEIPVFLQPVTPLTIPLEGGPVLPPSPSQVLNWQILMKRELKQVRVIPQTHKMIGQR